MISLREVAELAAVAPSTVSRVVNKAPNIAPETVAVVREAIKQLNYKPQRRGRPLHTADTPASPRRSNRIALLAPGLTRAAKNSPVYMDVIHGVESALTEADKMMVLRHLPPDASPNSELFPQKIDGVVIFGGGACSNGLQKQLQNLPCVQVMGVIEADEPWDHVSYANHRIGRIAAEYLLGRGHRRVAIILETAKYQTFAERLSTFKAAMQENGAVCTEIIDRNLLQNDGNVLKVQPEVMSAAVDRLLALPPASRPTAVFLTADTLAPGFYHQLQRSGLTPGKDIDIISCNNERPLLAHLHPIPATIDIYAESVGHKAVQQLLWRIEHPLAARQNILIDPQLVRGDEPPKKPDQNLENK